MIHVSVGPFGEIDRSGFGTLAGGQALWFNQSTLQTDSRPSAGGAAPIPHTAFPYQQFDTAFVVNGTNSYVYHQINETTIAQEHWDAGPSWLPSVNITIDTE